MSPATPPLPDVDAYETRPAHLGWRLLGLLYDLMPVIAIWIGVSALAYVLNGGERIAPGSLAALLMFLAVWLVTGAYAVASWRGGGHTLGMRPWRLQVRSADGRLAGVGALWIRYAVATAGIAVAGLGLWWCLVDPQRRALHDLAAGTLVLRRKAPPGKSTSRPARSID